MFRFVFNLPGRIALDTRQGEKWVDSLLRTPQSANRNNMTGLAATVVTKTISMCQDCLHSGCFAFGNSETSPHLPFLEIPQVAFYRTLWCEWKPLGKVVTTIGKGSR